jgi:hypothetical protein
MLLYSRRSLRPLRKKQRARGRLVRDGAALILAGFKRQGM